MMAYFMEVDIPRLGNFPDEIKGEGLMTTPYELLHAVDFSIGKKKGSGAIFLLICSIRRQKKARICSKGSIMRWART